jgi:hypothetical protein
MSCTFEVLAFNYAGPNDLSFVHDNRLISCVPLILLDLEICNECIVMYVRFPICMKYQFITMVLFGNKLPVINFDGL